MTIAYYGFCLLRHTQNLLERDIISYSGMFSHVLYYIVNFEIIVLDNVVLVSYICSKFVANCLFKNSITCVPHDILYKITHQHTLKHVLSPIDLSCNKTFIEL